LRHYAGIGGRNTPIEVCKKFTQIATKLQSKYILRSGHADGADLAFEELVHNGNKEIWLPWSGFNNSNSSYVLEKIIPIDVETICRKIYTRWNYVNETVKRFHARNVYQILGQTLDKPVEFVVAWTDRPESDCGGTQFGLKLAKLYGIETYNFYIPIEEIMFMSKLNNIIKEE